MPIAIASPLAAALELYLLLGVVFAIWFALAGARRLDPVAADGTWGFRALLLPGAALLWPVLLPRALRGGGTS
ncbi:MAG: hypothetical protein ACON4Z_15970 [Planctomycetota bacterium]